MRARRIRPWVYLVTAIVGIAMGVAVGQASLRHDLGLLGASWAVSLVMLIVGIAITILAWQVHRYVTTEPRKRVELRTVTPERAVHVLVFAKALAVAGAFLAGWYGGQALALLGHFAASYYRDVIIECVVACIASLADMVLGIVSEGLCRIPPAEGPEHPQADMRTGKRLA